MLRQPNHIDVICMLAFVYVLCKFEYASINEDFSRDCKARNIEAVRDCLIRKQVVSVSTSLDH